MLNFFFETQEYRYNYIHKIEIHYIYLYVGTNSNQIIPLTCLLPSRSARITESEKIHPPRPYGERIVYSLCL